MAKKRENTAKVLCFSYFDNMFALGFSKDEAIRFIQDYSERLKIQTVSVKEKLAEMKQKISNQKLPEKPKTKRQEESL